MVAVATAALIAAPAASAAPPKLSIERLPFTVHGFRFAPNERVKVTVITNARRSVTVKTGSNGRFTLVLRDVLLPRCGTFSVRATGARGDTAFYKSPRVRCSSGA